jgi:hypothetical protein
MTANALTQGIVKALKMQDHFDWRSLAVAAITAPIAQAVGKGVDDLFGVQGNAFNFGSRLTSNFVNGVIAQEVRIKVYHQGKMDYDSIAADAFGNALGSAIMEKMKTPSGEQKLKDEQAAKVGLTQAQRQAMAMGFGPLTDQTAQKMLAMNNGFKQDANSVSVDGSSESQTHPIEKISDADILNGRTKPVNYSNATVDSKNKEINIQVGINYETPSVFNPSTGSVTDAQYAKYVNLANSGVNKYWSRTVNLSGEDWVVNVSATNSGNGMPIKLANPGPSWMGDYSSRSYNGYPIKTGTLYYDSSNGYNSDAMFSMTAAHEIGHGFLTDSAGINWSWGHEGTSTSMGNMYTNAPQYPATGEIGLMPYYSENTSVKVYQSDVLQRTIASENDVKALLYISGRHK